MRDVSTGTQDAIALPITSPGYLIEMQFSIPVRISTRGALEWNSQNWLAMHCEVSGLAHDGTPMQDGSLTFVDADDTISVLVLAEGIANRPVKIWDFFGAAPGASDPVLRFSGVFDNYNIDDGSSTVQLALKQAEVLFAPRNLINAANGFNFLPANGTKINWGSQDYVLQGAN